MPFQLAASNTVTPGGTRDLGAVGQEAQPDAADALAGHRPPERPRSRAATAAWRARCAEIQLAPHSSLPSMQVAARARCARTLGERAFMIALVRPWAERHGQERGVQRVALGQAEGDVRRAQAHVHAELVADHLDRVERDAHRLRVGADGHRERVDARRPRAGCRGRRRPRRSCARSRGAARRSRGCRSRRSSGRSRPRRAWRRSAGSRSRRSSSPVTELTSALPS